MTTPYAPYTATPGLNKLRLRQFTNALNWMDVWNKEHPEAPVDLQLLPNGTIIVFEVIRNSLHCIFHPPPSPDDDGD